MRAVRYDGQGVRLTLDALPPQPAPGEALVKISRIALTPADAAAAAPPSSFRGTLGSHFIGVVKQINLPADAPPVMAARAGWTGKRVTMSPAIACASCDLCRHGLSAHCRTRKVLGIFEYDGCCTELISVPLSGLCEVPTSVSDDAAVFAPTLASALHAANMLRGEHNSFITLLGDNLLALLTAQTLARMNKSVRLLTAKPDRQRLCERWGIKHRAPEEPGRRQDQDVVVDCTGTSAGLRLSLQLVRPRGIVLLKSPLASMPYPAGRPMPDVLPGSAWDKSIDLTPVIANEIQIMGSRDGPVPDALRMLSEKAIDVESLLSKRLKLDAAAEGLRLITTGDAPVVVLDT